MSHISASPFIVSCTFAYTEGIEALPNLYNVNITIDKPSKQPPFGGSFFND